MRLQGDYHRYLAEFATGNDRKEAAENSLVAYKAASDIAMTELPPTHPIRLGLALNFSVRTARLRITIRLFRITSEQFYHLPKTVNHVYGKLPIINLKTTSIA